MVGSSVHGHTISPAPSLSPWQRLYPTFTMVFKRHIHRQGKTRTAHSRNSAVDGLPFWMAVRLDRGDPPGYLGPSVRRYQPMATEGDPSGLVLRPRLHAVHFRHSGRYTCPETNSRMIPRSVGRTGKNRGVSGLREHNRISLDDPGRSASSPVKGEQGGLEKGCGCLIWLSQGGAALKLLFLTLQVLEPRQHLLVTLANTIEWNGSTQELG